VPQPGSTEHRLFRGDRQVADGRQHVAAADRIALHLGDDRLPAVADRAVKLLDRQADQAAAAIAAFLFRTGGAGRVVAARAEGAVAGAGQHDDTDVAVILGVAHRLEHLLDRLGAKRVQHLRPVDRDRRDAVALIVEDVLIGH
jgi:hypothetical protein